MATVVSKPGNGVHDFWGGVRAHVFLLQSNKEIKL